MKKLIFSLFVLAACQSQPAQNVDPVALTAETIGFYCQMNLTEHSGPKGQIHLDGLPGAPLFFSQVRDAVAYARLPEQSARILAIYVNDMGADGATWESPGPQNWIAADAAFYVVGSSRAGGMGAAELVPFANRARADDFAAEYGGTVMTLPEIPDDAVIAPDAAGADETDADYEARLRALGQHQGG